MRNLPRRLTTHILTAEEIRDRAPAAFAERPAQHVSPDYNFVSTLTIMQLMEEAGWGVFNASQQKVRSAEYSDTTKHALSFRQREMVAVAPELGTLIPVLDMVNSHNWASRLEIRVGFFRLVCTNGMIGFAGSMGAYSLRHDHIPEDLNVIFTKFASLAGSMVERANRWHSIQLEDEQRNVFAMEAARIRFGDAATSDHAKALLLPHRAVDSGRSLWTTYNTVQENSIQGGARVGAMKRSMRHLSNIQAVSDINEGLVKLAETYAQ